MADYQDFEYLKKLSPNVKLEEEVNKTFLENGVENYNSNNCSTIENQPFVPLLVNSPANTILAKYIGSYTPDLFRQCWLVPNIQLPDICPTVEINSILYTFSQKLIDKNTIKAFLYHGFSSNIYTNYIGDKEKRTPQYEDFIRFINHFQKELFTQNYGNFDSFGFYFMQKYPRYTLMHQLVNFIFEISRFHGASLNGKILCNYYLPWNASIICQAQIFTTNQLDLALSAPIMNNVYQLYNQWQCGALNGSNGTFVDLFFFYINLFVTLDIVKDVFRDIVQQFSYEITKKEFCPKPYMTKKAYLECAKLYQIYTDNKLRLQPNA
jgi:hypothetical protein